MVRYTEMPEPSFPCPACGEGLELVAKYRLATWIVSCLAVPIFTWQMGMRGGGLILVAGLGSQIVAYFLLFLEVSSGAAKLARLNQGRGTAFDRTPSLNLTGGPENQKEERPLGPPENSKP